MRISGVERSSSMHWWMLRDSSLVSSFVEKDLGVLVDKFNLSQ